jgi:hypothetical protein
MVATTANAALKQFHARKTLMTGFCPKTENFKPGPSIHAAPMAQVRVQLGNKKNGQDGKVLAVGR